MSTDCKRCDHKLGADAVSCANCSEKTCGDCIVDVKEDDPRRCDCAFLCADCALTGEPTECGGCMADGCFMCMQTDCYACEAAGKQELLCDSCVQECGSCKQKVCEEHLKRLFVSVGKLNKDGKAKRRRVVACDGCVDNALKPLFANEDTEEK